MAKTYTGCKSSAPLDVTVDMALLSTGAMNHYYIGPNEFWEQDSTYRSTVSQTLDEALTINYTYDEAIIFDYVNPSTPDQYAYTPGNPSSTSIPAGQLYSDEVIQTYYAVSDGYLKEILVLSGQTLADQASTPDCSGYTPPASCHIGITGTTSTTPTQRGDDDGTMYAGITGQTGSTIEWRVNGTVYAGQTGPTATFTGYSAGDYVVKAMEAGCWDQETITVDEGEFRTGDFTVFSPTGSMVAVENPIILDLRTAIHAEIPVYSVNSFDVDGAFTGGCTITFDLTFPYIYHAEFISKGYPDRANYFLESVLTDSVGNPVGTNSLTEIATSLAEALQKDAILSRLYYIYSDSNMVYMEAKEYGDKYDLTGQVSIVGGDIHFTQEVYGEIKYDGQATANYSLYTEIFVDDDFQYGSTPVAANYRRIHELELPFSNTNVHQFDLSTTLKNFVSSPIHNIIFTGVTYLADYVAGYYCVYGEKYPLIENSTTKKKRVKGKTAYGNCCNAALNFEDPNNMDDYTGVSGLTMTTGVTFLNTAPDTKYSHRDGDEILYFLVPKNYANPLAVYGNIYMYDGTEYLTVKFFDVTTGVATFGGVAAISVGYDALGLSSYEPVAGSKIRKVDIQVYQSLSGVTGYTYTEQKSYLFELDEQPDTFNVAFLSKLGTYETYSFYGELVESQQIERSLYQKPYDVADDGSALPGFEYNSVYDTDYTKIWTVNSGIITEDNFDYLMGLLQSNKVYRYDVAHKNYLIVQAHTATKSTNTNEYNLQIVFSETINENNVIQ